MANLMDLYPAAVDEIFEELAPEHATMTDAALAHRVDRCNEIGRDALNYGISRAAAARKVGAHAAQVLMSRQAVGVAA